MLSVFTEGQVALTLSLETIICAVCLKLLNSIFLLHWTSEVKLVQYFAEVAFRKDFTSTSSQSDFDRFMMGTASRTEPINHPICGVKGRLGPLYLKPIRAVIARDVHRMEQQEEDSKKEKLQNIFLLILI